MSADYDSRRLPQLKPLKPIDARLGDSQDAESFGYYNIKRRMDGKIGSAIDATGQEVQFIDGHSPERAALNRQQQRQQPANAAPAQAQQPPARQPMTSRPTGASVALANAPEPGSQPVAPQYPGMSPVVIAGTPADAGSAMRQASQFPAPPPTVTSAQPAAPSQPWWVGKFAKDPGMSYAPPEVRQQMLAATSAIAHPLPYGKISQQPASPFPMPQTVAPGQTAYFNGQPVAAGSTVTPVDPRYGHGAGIAEQLPADAPSYTGGEKGKFVGPDEAARIERIGSAASFPTPSSPAGPPPASLAAANPVSLPDWLRRPTPLSPPGQTGGTPSIPLRPDEAPAAAASPFPKPPVAPPVAPPALRPDQAFARNSEELINGIGRGVAAVGSGIASAVKGAGQFASDALSLSAAPAAPASTGGNPGVQAGENYLANNPTVAPRAQAPGQSSSSNIQGGYDIEALKAKAAGAAPVTASTPGTFEQVGNFLNTPGPNEARLRAQSAAATPATSSASPFPMPLNPALAGVTGSILQPQAAPPKPPMASVPYPMPPTSGQQTGSLQTGGLTTGGLQTGGLQTGGLQTGKLETGKLETGGLSTGNLQTGNLQTGNPVAPKPPLAPASPPSSFPSPQLTDEQKRKLYGEA
jgi:hypothetical protein